MIQSVSDLLQALDEHPEWRDELRRRLLTDDFLALPGIVRDLGEAQRRTEQRVEELATAQQRTERRVEELAVAQQRTEQRVEELAAAQQRTEQRLEALIVRVEDIDARLKALIVRVDLLTEAVDRLVKIVERHDEKISRMYGRFLEWDYERKVASYFGRLLRRARVVNLIDLEDELLEHLTLDELGELYDIDLVVAGRPRRVADAPETHLLIEVSWFIEMNDLERAKKRAELFKKAGYSAIPAVAGEGVADMVAEALDKADAVMFLGGQVVNSATPFLHVGGANAAT